MLSQNPLPSILNLILLLEVVTSISKFKLITFFIIQLLKSLSRSEMDLN